MIPMPVVQVRAPMPQWSEAAGAAVSTGASRRVPLTADGELHDQGARIRSPCPDGARDRLSALPFEGTPARDACRPAIERLGGGLISFRTHVSPWHNPDIVGIEPDAECDSGQKWLSPAWIPYFAQAAGRATKGWLGREELFGEWPEFQACFLW